MFQCDIGHVDYPTDENLKKLQTGYKQDIATVNQHVHRIVRCIIDCKTFERDAVSVLNALEVARCFAAKCWENSPTQFHQLEGFAAGAVRRLIAVNICTLEDLRNAEPYKIEAALSRNPPFGVKILKTLETIPKFRIFAYVASKVCLHFHCHLLHF